jgi:uncharacterized membrane protein HdeD (DUF308 family)
MTLRPDRDPDRSALLRDVAANRAERWLLRNAGRPGRGKQRRAVAYAAAAALVCGVVALETRSAAMLTLSLCMALLACINWQWMILERLLERHLLATRISDRETTPSGAPGALADRWALRVVRITRGRRWPTALLAMAGAVCMGVAIRTTDWNAATLALFWLALGIAYDWQAICFRILRRLLRANPDPARPG